MVKRAEYDELIKKPELTASERQTILDYALQLTPEKFWELLYEMDKQNAEPVLPETVYVYFEITKKRKAKK